MDRRKILIIGCNPTGHSLSLELLKQRLSIDADIIIIDDSKEITEAIKNGSSLHFGGMNLIPDKIVTNELKVKIEKAWINESDQIKNPCKDQNKFDPPEDFTYNHPPRMKKDRNRPDKRTLARLRKRR